MADGEVIKIIPNTTFVSPCKEPNPPIAPPFFRLEKIRLINPFTKSMAPMIIIIVLIVSPGIKRNTPPTKIVTILRIIELPEPDPNKFRIILFINLPIVSQPKISSNIMVPVEKPGAGNDFF